MPERDFSDEETSDNSSDSDSAGKPGSDGAINPAAMTEYEKQRLSRIAENQARMATLGLPKIASSIMSTKKKTKKEPYKGKSKVFDDDDYSPEEDGPSSSNSSQDGDDAVEEDDDGDYRGKKSSGSRSKKSKGSKSKKALSRSTLSNEDYVDDDDEALKQAIALSLQDSVEASAVVRSGFSQSSDVVNANVNERKGNSQIPKDTGRRKGKKTRFASRLQMTEDELILHFFQFDEYCNGGISVRDLQRIATAHDFMWTDAELAEMIRCFDSDGDGQLSLDEFRKIVVRCKMIKEPEQS